MVHEVSDRARFFREIRSILKPGGVYLIVELLFHVPKTAFNETVRIARDVGFQEIGSPVIILSRAVLLIPKM